MPTATGFDLISLKGGENGAATSTRQRIGSGASSAAVSAAEEGDFAFSFRAARH
jgi:hypothetical protein